MKIGKMYFGKILFLSVKMEKPSKVDSLGGFFQVLWEIKNWLISNFIDEVSTKHKGLN